MPSEAHCQADRGINAEFSRKILDRSVTILLDKNIWTTDEVMDYLLIGRNTLYELLRTGKIKAFKIGSNWKIPKKAVDEYIIQQSGIK